MNTQTRQVIRTIEPQSVVEGAGVRLNRSIAGATAWATRAPSARATCSG